MPMSVDVVAEARRWLGTPWVHQHIARGVGVDCRGLVIGVARALGLVEPGFDVTGYERAPDGSMLEVCGRHMQRIARAEMRPGDVVVMAVETRAQHMGIVGDYVHGGLSMIHAASGRGVVEHRLLFGPRLRFVAAYRLPGVAA